MLDIECLIKAKRTTGIKNFLQDYVRGKPFLKIFYRQLRDVFFYTAISTRLN